MAKLILKAREGFSLVELSIVLLIIAIFAIVIVNSASLVRQAKINSVITDLRSHQTSYNNFISRYDQAPGDFQAAETVWPNCTGTPGSCNGNGNGIIDSAGESLAAWRELNLAGMIQGNIADPAGVASALPGQNVPESKITYAGYMMLQGNDTLITDLGGNPTGLWNDSTTNAVFIGKPLPGIYGNSLFLSSGAIKPVEAFNIDQKLDDGISNAIGFSGANSGTIRTIEGFASGTCLVGGNATTASNYAINSTDSACILVIKTN